MTTPRDELAALIADALYGEIAGEFNRATGYIVRHEAEQVADAILAAGWVLPGDSPGTPRERHRHRAVRAMTEITARDKLASVVGGEAADKVIDAGWVPGTMHPISGNDLARMLRRWAEIADESPDVIHWRVAEGWLSVGGGGANDERHEGSVIYDV